MYFSYRRAAVSAPAVCRGMQKHPVGASSCAPAAAAGPPLEYTAFRQLHQEPYLRFACERLRDRQASGQVVEAVFGHLEADWPAVISSPRPAAVAWQLLDSLIAAALRARAARGGDIVHRVLPPAQADVVILRCRLRLSQAEAAEVMGVEEPAVASHLRMAERTIPALREGDTGRDKRKGA
ncbi:sigma factor-like helix-turn-helix DNA-binding protein [Streptomyces sp. NPDC058644]|uniref:sigma-70 region 4 domain-containing protein n=1 Tax=unclassified Streptomyces TaxID=2593676 RepID=UPI003650F9F2